jgi:hypothetical protein
MEFSLDKDVIDPFRMGVFQLSVGFEEGDSPDCMKTIYGAVGMEYTGNKQDWGCCAWENPLYYPTFNLGDSVEIENKPAANVHSGINLQICPNPFNPTTSINYYAATSGELSIYTLSGARVFEKDVQGRGSFSWSATGLASGTYLVRLSVEGNTLQKRMLYLK